MASPPSSSMAGGMMPNPNMYGRGMPGQMDQRMLGGMMGPDPNSGGWHSGQLEGRQPTGSTTGGMGMRGGYPGSGGRMGVDDWRLPPLPELDLPPGWEDMRGQVYSSVPPQDQRGNSGPRSGMPRPLLPPQRASGHGNASGWDRPEDQNNGGWTR
jgi:hypothetical protein